MLPDLRGERIAIPATSGFEQSELLEPQPEPPASHHQATS